MLIRKMIHRLKEQRVLSLMENVAEFLRSIEPFITLDSQTIDRIATQFSPVRFQAGENVFMENDRGDAVYITARGELSVLKDTGKGTRELKRIGQGEIFGEMALFSEGIRSATVRAITDAECLKMTQEDFNDLIDREAQFSQRMLKFLTDRLRRSDEMATKAIINAHQALIFSLANLAETRDKPTGDHLFRVREYCALLASLLIDHPDFAGTITTTFIENIYFVSPLHDIGKVGIADSILLKPGNLTKAEYEIIKTHPVIGSESIATVLQYCENESFRMAYNIVRYHHERYDGQGYPEGLSGEAIPLEARIITLADCYDALLSERSYKMPLSYEEAIAEMRKMTGTVFDPVIAEVILSNIGAFERIHQKYN